ncbi:type VI secretion system tube protein Hcp [Roseibium salinum]|nr:type VI secretion system tube protein Hcp [Roseibium salinum]
MELEGIKGEAQDKSHKDKIDVLSWSWGASQSGTTHMGGGSGSGKAFFFRT